MKTRFLFVGIALTATFLSRAVETDTGLDADQPSLGLLNVTDGRVFEGRLVPHEPIYFLWGSTTPAAKFQFSFKYRFLEAANFMEESGRPTLNLGFTQRSLWNTEADSSPFYDTSYMPEILIESSAPADGTDGFFNWFGYQSGYRHESNGRDAAESRSLNVMYFRPVFSLGRMEDWHAVFAPEVFVYTSMSKGNPDIADYRGYYRLRGSIGHRNGAAVVYSFHTDKDFYRPTYQLDLTLPLKAKFLNFATYLNAQYFDGYGESLLTYTERSHGFRVGFALVR